MWFLQQTRFYPLQIRGFHGRLRLPYASEDPVNVLLEIPTGLHSTEIQVHNDPNCLLQTARLVEACSKALMKLSYMVSSIVSLPPSPGLAGSTAQNTDTGATPRRRQQ